MAHLGSLAFRDRRLGAGYLAWVVIHLQSALTNEWIQQQILTACYLHHTNSQLTGQAAMPQVIMGGAISAGALNSVNHLLVLLEEYLGLKIR